MLGQNTNPAPDWRKLWNINKSPRGTYSVFRKGVWHMKEIKMEVYCEEYGKKNESDNWNI